MGNKTHISMGGSFCNLLTIVFITLKLTGFINWSWLLVFSPMIAQFALLIFFIGLIVVFKIIAQK